ncbi:hypothetical protein A0H81_05941 [Grifola frondosa]|uniref:Uncharacterized protein n=1 Tax=Grifola frondosa TaxID=5627 RepID=A0A1C7M9D0_GRIFR|nr:hypothetical protein A0H81_05941 [Grifola frondosa]
MASVLGDMDNIAVKPAAKSRKRKPEPLPDYDDGSSSPSPVTAAPNRKTTPYGYRGGLPDADTSSDGLVDDAVGPSSDDFVFSPKKKLKTEAAGLTPAIKRLGKLGVQSGPDEYDSSFDDIDMDAFMDVDEDEIGKSGSRPDAKTTKMDVDEIKPLKLKNGNADTKKKQDDTPSWLSVTTR